MVDQNMRCLVRPSDKVMIICDANVSGANMQSKTEVQGNDVVKEVCGVLAEFGAENVAVQSTKYLVDCLSSDQLPADLVVNLGAGLADAFRFGQTPLLLEMVGVPYSGPTPYCMMLCRDKHRTKSVVRDLTGILAPISHFMTRDFVQKASDITQRMFPVIVKPNDLGNSVGVTGTIVSSHSALKSELTKVGEVCVGDMLVEKFILGSEATVYVSGNGDDLTCHALGLQHSDGTILDFNYVRCFSHKIQPAKELVWRPLEELISTRAMSDVIDSSRKVWRALGCRDSARFDFRIDADGRAWFIEANAQPDMSGAALYVQYLNSEVFGDPLGIVRDYISAFLRRAGALEPAS